MENLNNTVRQIHNQNPNLIKLPLFSANDPEMWFVQVESVFARNEIDTEIAKTRLIIAQVDADTLNCVRHIVMLDPKPDDAYTQLKNGIIAHFATCKETRLFQLIRRDVLSSGKPSQILSRIRSLNVGNCDEEVLKAMFLAKLPYQHQLMITSNSNMTLNQMAERADRMAEVDRIANAATATVLGESSSTTKVDEIKSLTEKVASLKEKFLEVQERKSRDQKRRGRGNNNFYNDRGRSRGHPFYQQNYRGRGRGRSYHRSNSFGRNYNPQYNNFYRSPSRDRFRSSGPYDRSSHSSHHSHGQCCSRKHCNADDGN